MSWPPQGKILVPVDFSEQSLAAVDTALAICGDPARVRVIHVIYEMPAGQPELWALPDRPTQAREAESALREFLQGDAKREAIVASVAFGDPGHEIAAYAEKLGVDLIVMPSHGRRGIARILIGSVAERVLRLAHCPVLVLRGLKHHKKQP